MVLTPYHTLEHSKAVSSGPQRAEFEVLGLGFRFLGPRTIVPSLPPALGLAVSSYFLPVSHEFQKIQ